MHFGHLYVFFGNMSIQVLCSFLNCFFKMYVELCEFFIYFNINPLSDISFANIFSKTVSCLFVLSVFFTMQKFFSVMQSHFYFIFILLFMSEETDSTKNC